MEQDKVDEDYNLTLMGWCVFSIYDVLMWNMYDLHFS